MNKTQQRILGIVPVGDGITVEYDLWWYKDDGGCHAPQRVVGLAVVEETDAQGTVTTRLRPVVSNKGLFDESDPEFAGIVYDGPDRHPLQVARHTQCYVDVYVELMGALPEDLA